MHEVLSDECWKAPLLIFLDAIVFMQKHKNGRAHGFWKVNHTANTRQKKAARWFHCSLSPKSSIEKRVNTVSVMTS